MGSRSCTCSIPSLTRRLAVLACLMWSSFFPSFLPYSGCSYFPRSWCPNAYSVLPHIRPLVLPTRPFPVHSSDRTIIDTMHCQPLAASLCTVRNETGLKLDGREWLRNSPYRLNAIMHLFWNTDFPGQRQVLRNRVVRRTASSNHITRHVRDLLGYKRLTVIPCVKASILPLIKERWCPKPGASCGHLPYANKKKYICSLLTIKKDV